LLLLGFSFVVDSPTLFSILASSFTAASSSFIRLAILELSLFLFSQDSLLFLLEGLRFQFLPQLVQLLRPFVLLFAALLPVIFAVFNHIPNQYTHSLTQLPFLIPQIFKAAEDFFERLGMPHKHLLFFLLVILYCIAFFDLVVDQVPYLLHQHCGRFYSVVLLTSRGKGLRQPPIGFPYCRAAAQTPKSRFSLKAGIFCRAHPQT